MITTETPACRQIVSPFDSLALKYLTRMNWCATPSAGKLSKQAFDLLKRRHPGSREAQTTKYWFKPRS
jgi:hypothetical protein